jgi:hypothetical protein
MFGLELQFEHKKFISYFVLSNKIIYTTLEYHLIMAQRKRES